MEQPRYAPVLADLPYLQRSMHFLITYSLSSVYPGSSLLNVPISYYPSHILTAQAALTPPNMSIKDGYGTKAYIATFTSNCGNAGAKERFAYLQELMKHVEVHSYGRCLHNRDEPEMENDPAWPPIAQRRARKVKVLSRYHFYLAFENLAIADYVTEKVFEGLVAGTVPVYRGSASIHRFMPSNDSFINANDLSALQLAQLLQRVAADPGLYAGYMGFKQRPLSPHFQHIAGISYVHPNVAVRICNFADSWQQRGLSTAQGSSSVQ
jgi:hypothetical protein